MMTRDSHWWYVAMASAVIAAVASRMNLIDPLLPAQHTAAVHSVIELLALITGVVSGFMKASPLPISDQGREKYMTDTVKPRP